jgi:hypothetical protein
MSTLWTPDGERPVGRSQPAAPPAAPPGPAGSPPPAGFGGLGGPDGALDGGMDEAEMRAQMAELQEQLAQTPAEMVIANHAFGLFELAALHLSLQPPQLDQARTAIDACAALVEGMAGRLGEPEAELVDGLAQLRLAFVQIRGAMGGDPPA